MSKPTLEVTAARRAAGSVADLYNDDLLTNIPRQTRFHTQPLRLHRTLLIEGATRTGICGSRSRFAPEPLKLRGSVSGLAQRRLSGIARAPPWALTMSRMGELALAWGLTDVRIGRVGWWGAEPLCGQPRRAADAAARNRLADGAAARVPHPRARRRTRPSRSRRDRGGQGARPLLPRVRQPDRGGALLDLPRHAPRPNGRLRRRAAGGRDLARADARVPRPLPRARRLALAARRRRARAPADRRAAAPRRRGRDRPRSCSRRTRT